MQDYYGYLGKIGHIYPSSGTVAEPEIYRILPSGFSLLTTRIFMKRADEEGLKGLLKRVKEASLLLATAEVDIIAFNCTLGSLIGGGKTGDKINSMIEKTTGIKATNTSESVLKALNSLKSREILLLTPYKKEMTELEKTFLESRGFNVVAEFWLGIDDPVKQGSINPALWVEKVRKFSGKVDMDTVFISCSGVPAIEAIYQIEQEFNVRVITSNQALIWNCLRELGFTDEVKGSGRLFKH